MFQKFNNNNIITKFIKNLLKTTNIPTVPVWKPGDMILKDNVYIGQGYIVRAKKSFLGVLKEDLAINYNSYMAGSIENYDCRLVKGNIIKKGSEILAIVSQGFPFFVRLKLKADFTVEEDNFNKFSESQITQSEFFDFDSETTAIWGDAGSIVLIKKDSNIQGSNVNNIFIENSPTTVFDAEYFDVICPYTLWEEYLGVTTKFNSNSSFYDYDTHYYLGEYLRALRDLKSLDLMRYYNCWDGTYTDKLRFNVIGTSNNNSITYSIGITEKLTSEDDGYKILMVPAKHNTRYTIYADCASPIIIKDVYYDGVEFLKDGNGNIKTNFSKYISAISLNNPISIDSYQISTTEANPINKYPAPYYNLLIQIPEKNASGVIILEGDYADNKLAIIGDGNKLSCPKSIIDYAIYGTSSQYTCTPKQKSMLFKSPVKLSYYNFNNSYALDNKLIEFLVLNAICKDEEVCQNVQKFQTLFKTYNFEKIFNKKLNAKFQGSIGSFDDQLQFYIYSLIIDNPIESKLIGIDGNITKEVEKILLRGERNV